MKNAYETIKELSERFAEIKAKASEGMDDMQRLLGEYPEEYAAQMNEIDNEIVKLEEKNPFIAMYHPDIVAVTIGIYKTEDEAKEALKEIKDCDVSIKNRMTYRTICRAKNSEKWREL